MLFQILSGNVDFLSIVMQILATLLVMIIVLPFHELAHGYVAYKLGDNTAKNQGRLTFNPLAHINYFGAVCLLLVGFGWAEPVPVNPFYFKKPKRDMALVALAGPVANIIAALVGTILLNVLFLVIPDGSYDASWARALMVFFASYIRVNVGLAVFNLIPLPPLDGSKILGAFLPTETYAKILANERTLSSILILLCITDIIDKIMYYPQQWLYSLVLTVGSFPFTFFS